MALLQSLLLAQLRKDPTNAWVDISTRLGKAVQVRKHNAAMGDSSAGHISPMQACLRLDTISDVEPSPDYARSHADTHVHHSFTLLPAVS
jgi:hypothetical protein